MSENVHTGKDSNDDGTITNPGAQYERDDSVGDAADDANELRFSEEEELITEQGHAEQSPGDVGREAAPPVI
ncbi:hypothetical protein IV500_10745 [Paeniglutamicibacter antarcticus]|uniref:Uncharacterized protein n=1 Tax=Arthrobacter terrae TaxID=2935737 RepID=A0A931CKA1_9MICC|nr:hypothetical protein [Arthrobacter terrae]MBG0739863.1 hypothetical protein [Arthrobacter terrae]